MNRALDAVHLRARLVPGGVNAGGAAPSHAVELRLSHGAGAACNDAPRTGWPLARVSLLVCAVKKLSLLYKGY